MVEIMIGYLKPAASLSKPILEPQRVAVIGRNDKN